MSGSPGTDLRWVPSGRTLKGELRVPPSKSLTQRYLNLALLAGAPTVVESPLESEDTRLFLTALMRCGLTVEETPGELRLAPGAGRPERAELFCGNAGTMFRFLVASLATVPGQWYLDGVARLRERPSGPLLDALRRLGAGVECLEEEGCPPVRVSGGGLRGGTVHLAAGWSSQFLSALLMAALGAEEAVTVEVESLASAPYAELTLEAIAAFGGRAARDGSRFQVEPGGLGGVRVRVEGDYSSACYWAAAAALTGGRVLLRGLDPGSKQGDREFLGLLVEMGAEVGWEAGGVGVSGGGGLRGLEADLGGMPDQVPTLAALAPFASGLTRIRNVPHLRIKESDRLAVMARELRRLGAEIRELDDGLEIRGVWADRRPPAGQVVAQPEGDHRIAMSLAVAGLRRPGVGIADPAVVAKSYPAFWDDLGMLFG